MKKPKAELLAPNGQPSNLNEVQYRLVRTPEFKAWFGDWENSPETASKVVDENKEPLVVYHSTTKNFTKFKDSKYSNYIFFSNDIDHVEVYGDIVYHCFLSIKNPSSNLYPKQDLKENNQDGFINNYEEKGFFNKKTRVYCVIKSNQIKLADGTNTTFDSNNPDIRFSLGGEIEEYKKQGILELNFYPTNSKHAKEHGIDAKNPLYLQNLIVKESDRLKFIGKKVLLYLDEYAKQNGNDVIFGYVNQKATMTKDNRTGYFTEFTDVDWIKHWLFRNGYCVKRETNNFYKVLDKEKKDKCDSFLLAPNGNPSNLNEVQYRLVRTPEFKAWFGDWENSPETASKVVDENKEPLICYHGTRKYDRFYKFRKGSKGYLGGGIYFTSNKEKSKDYARYGTIYGNQYEVFLDIKEPFNVTGSIGTDDFLNKLYGTTSIYRKRSDKQSFDTMIIKSSDVKKLLDKGYDGIFWNLAEEFVVYEPNQIKLADGTNTTFDSNNPDIRYNNGGLTMKKPKAKLLAPNGKLSNLNEVQYRLVRTPEFKAWFGDWENSPETASKILDYNGEPLPVYHGTNSEPFVVFYDGSFFTDDYMNADGYASGEMIYEVFLNIKKPLIINARGRKWDNLKNKYGNSTRDIASELDTDKYDGVIFNNINDNWFDDEMGDTQNVYFSINPEQIKLADGTNTTFDGNNPDIRYEIGGIVVGENEENNKFPTFDEAYELIEDSINNQGNSFLDESGDGMFEDKEKANKYVKEIYDFLLGYYDMGMIPIYRGVMADEVDLEPYSIGESWSLSLDSARNFATHLGGKRKDLKIISAYVPKGNVDWEGAFTLYPLFSDFGDSDSEFELPVPANNKLYNVEVADFNNKFEIGGIFQGTPHEFDKYSTDYMGTGEGQQVFGWGLYFTDIKDIAKQYAKNEALIEKEIAKKSNDSAHLWIYSNIPSRVEDKLAYLKNELNDLEEKQRQYPKLDLADKIKTYRELIDIVENYKGKVYSVTLFKGENESDYDLLLWDSAVNVEQLEKIFIEAEKIGGIALKEGWYFGETEYGITPELLAAGHSNVNLFDERSSVVRGDRLYSHLAKELGSDKEASLFLLRAGIDGIKYKSGTLSGMEDKEGYNYVIFDANEVTIENKESYKNGGLTMKKPKAELLAPNGKPSNLAPEQYRIVRTPAFKAWFGDWENSPETASKVVDDNGEPLTCFHGSNNEFNVFEEKYLGSSNDMGFYGQGFYFTFNTDEKWMVSAIGEAAYYGKIVKPYFIKALNPFIFGELKKYKGIRINFSGTQSLVFLNNIAKKFPQLAEKITLNKTIYNPFNKENEIIQVPISILSDLIDKYSEDLKIIEVEDRGEIKINGYLKSKTKEVFYDNTKSGGTKGSYLDFDILSYGIDGNNKKESIEILLIEEALEKYERIEVRYNPEGYMTRFPEITDAIKENHDCIMQGETGDELVVFKPTQIKLSDGTNTTFDSNNPDIRYNEGGGITQKNSFNNRFKNSKLVGGNIESVKSNDFVELKYIQNGKKLGYLNYYFDTDGTFSSDLNYKNELYIDMVEVKSQYRGKGIAKQLINKAIEDAKKLGIQVVTLKRDVGMGCQYGSEYDTYLKKIYSSIGFVETWTEKESEESGGEKNICAMHYTTFDSNNPDIRYAEGGSIPDLLSSQEVEYKLGRKLDWWNDDIVYLSGIEYKKVYLRPEYKKVIE